MSDELHSLSGAYAVHALPDRDGVLFAMHMEECPSCRTEVRRLRETAVLLALAVAEPPPAALRARVLTAVARTPQAPAGSPGDVTVWAAGPYSGDATVWVPKSSSAGQVVTGSDVVPLRRRSRRGRVVAGLAAVSTAAAVALGVVVFDARRDLGDLQVRDGEVAAVLAAPDVRTVRLPVTAGGSGTVVVSRARGRMVFTSSGLPELPRSRVYELWLMGPDGIRSAGLLDRRPDGVTTPMLAGAAKGDQRIGLTIEPAGGSEQPTTQPVLFAELPLA
ncbi:anti-sigma factor [Nonomuraea aurantiaca]|uniref:anti-sigma factor n=1 Tax=Nonomuraea aurantiaca TaxID=2878562 RepID=UPI001CDA4F5F|nr:anti-sigma factor [Nonomuraea aurantiaca]MCA2225087.1 anti-sigma factor [Nonomuraea aurantiaca]